MERSCSTCECWQRDGADGVCKAHAPRPGMVVEGMPASLCWPRTLAEDVCWDCYVKIEIKPE